MGFDDRRIVLCGAGPPGQGGAAASLVEIVARILRPYALAVDVSAPEPTLLSVAPVAEGRAQLGAMNLGDLVSAHRATNNFATAEPERELRVVANVNHPVWLAIAARRESEITDLAEIATRRIPARLRVSPSALCSLVLEHYGLSSELLSSLGGSLHLLSEELSDASGLGDGIPEAEWVREGAFDVIIALVYAGYTVETHDLLDATMREDLVFLDVPDEVARAAARAGLGEWGTLPRHLLKGSSRDVASVCLHPTALYGRADMPDGFARLVAQALDENRAMLRQSHLALSYDPLNVAMNFGVPLHPGARRYYTSMRYPVGNAEDDHDHGDGDHDHDHGEGHDHEYGASHHDHSKAAEDNWSHVGVRRGAHDHGHADHGHADHGHADHGHADHGHADHGHADHGQSDHTDTDHAHADHAHGDHAHDHGESAGGAEESWSGGFGRRA